MRFRLAISDGIALLVGLTVALSLAEVGARLASKRDADGGFWVGRTQLRPYPVPVEATRSKLDAYRARERTYIRNDADLGWSLTPGGSSDDDLYHANELGYRDASPEAPGATLEPPPGVLRIALFGDSFTHCAEVRFEDSWGEVVREQLEARGQKVEVLNFGVDAYGMDQAYLRWQRDGRRFAPHVVLFGFLAADIQRNVNLVRVLYKPWTEFLFSKPRFVLEDGGLRLINARTVPLEDLVERLASFAEWDLARFEGWFGDDFTPRWWSKSRLLSLAQARIWKHDRYAVYAPGTEAYEVTLAIIAAFKRDVVSAGSRFAIVHLPGRRDVHHIHTERPLQYQEILDEVEERHGIIDPLPVLAEAAREIGDRKTWRAKLFQDNGHYAPRTNRLVGGIVADAITVWAADAVHER